MQVTRDLTCDPEALWTHYYVVSLWSHPTLGEQRYNEEFSCENLTQTIDQCLWRADIDFPKLVMEEGLKFIYILLNKGRDTTHQI